MEKFGGYVTKWAAQGKRIMKLSLLKGSSENRVMSLKSISDNWTLS
jgi:hypothetical protein